MDFILSFLSNFLVYLFKPAINLFRSFTVKVNLIECSLDGLRSSDGEGGFIGGSRVHFRIEIINRKDKKFIISKIYCRARVHIKRSLSGPHMNRCLLLMFHQKAVRVMMLY